LNPYLIGSGSGCVRHRLIVVGMFLVCVRIVVIGVHIPDQTSTHFESKSVRTVGTVVVAISLA